MRVLSFDVGIKNLSYCVLEKNDTITILEWDNLCVIDGNTKKISFDVLTDNILQTLMSKFDDEYTVDLVLIENQPMLKNGNMKSVSVIIYTYFSILKVQYGNINDVKFISAMNKLKCQKAKEMSNIESKTYKDRKNIGIKVARAYIEKLCPDKIAWFDGNKKKDDLSDSLLAGIYYLENNRAF